MGHEERRAPDLLGEVRKSRHRNRDAVVRGRAAAKLVEDDQRPAAGPAQDRARCRELNVESRLACAEIVGSTHPGF